MNRIQLSFLGLLLCFVVLSLSSAEAKPGRCPPERFYIKKTESQPRECENDSGCPGDKKCCKDNESRFCKPPAKVNTETSCTTKAPKVGTYDPCDDRCSIDSDCAPESKCCFMDCGMKCTPSVGEKKGICEKEKVTVECFAPQRSICADDTECPKNEKCCRKGCGSTCMPPLKGQCLDEGKKIHTSYTQA